MNSKYLVLLGALALSGPVFAGADLDEIDSSQDGPIAGEAMETVFDQDDDGILSDETVSEQLDTVALPEFSDDS